MASGAASGRDAGEGGAGGLPLASAVTPLPEPARPAAGNGSQVAVPQAPVLSELVLSTGASSELDDYLYTTVLETLLGDRSGQMVGPAPEVKTQPFTPLLRIKDWPTLGTIVLRRLQTGLGAPSARTLEKELVVELDYPAADAAAAIDNWARERFFPRHVELTDCEPGDMASQEQPGHLSGAGRLLIVHPRQHRTASSRDVERPDRGVQPQAQIGGGGRQGG